MYMISSLHFTSGLNELWKLVQIAYFCKLSNRKLYIYIILELEKY